MQHNFFSTMAVNIPTAVAAIVTTHGHHLFTGEIDPKLIEARLVAFTETLTRTMAQALINPINAK